MSWMRLVAALALVAIASFFSHAEVEASGRRGRGDQVFIFRDGGVRRSPNRTRVFVVPQRTFGFDPGCHHGAGVGAGDQTFFFQSSSLRRF